jgi:wyosine [tRNA(Phe)-imidazoG37] synthetase (radical SAM superfamily)
MSVHGSAAKKCKYNCIFCIRALKYIMLSNGYNLREIPEI